MFIPAVAAEEVHVSRDPRRATTGPNCGGRGGCS